MNAGYCTKSALETLLSSANRLVSKNCNSSMSDTRTGIVKRHFGAENLQVVGEYFRYSITGPVA